MTTTQNFTETSLADLPKGPLGIRYFRMKWLATKVNKPENWRTNLGVVFPDGFTSIGSGHTFSTFTLMKEFYGAYAPCQIDIEEE